MVNRAKDPFHRTSEPQRADGPPPLLGGDPSANDWRSVTHQLQATTLLLPWLSFCGHERCATLLLPWFSFGGANY